MYNRYIHNDNGTYTRIQEEEEAVCQEQQQSDKVPPQEPYHSPAGAGPLPTGPEGLSGFLRRILDQLHLDHIDSGDLILLGLLFFLYREKADEELLTALGLLLIL